jgi:hypothetical protein
MSGVMSSAGRLFGGMFTGATTISDAPLPPGATLVQRNKPTRHPHSAMSQKAGGDLYNRQSTAEKFEIANRLLTDPNAVALPHVIEEAKRTIDFVKQSKSRPTHAQAGVLYDTLQNLKSQEAARKKAAAATAPAAAAPAAQPAAPAAPAPVFTQPAPESSPAAAAAGNIVGTQLTGTLGTDTANAGRKGGGSRRRGRMTTILGGFGGGGETFGG